jgi:hypothetical protein
MAWFGVRRIFKLPDQRAFEERITVWRVDSFEAAVKLAEAEANEYQVSSGAEYLGLAQAYHLAADRIGHASEVFSLIRESSLGPGGYLKRFFDTGQELQGDLTELASRVGFQASL